MPRPDQHLPTVLLAIEPGQCVGCAICVDVCPSDALAMDRADLTPRQIPGRCTGCAVCVPQCPTGAITLSRACLSADPR